MNSVGIDIVEFEEIRERMSDRFIHRILSEEELVKFNRLKKPESRVAYLAGRFAAKEAYTKVYKHFETPLNFTDVLVLNDEYGAPYIISKYKPEDIVSISISHSRSYAVAICIKEEKENK